MEYLASSGCNEDVKPNTSCYSIVIDAFAKSDKKDAGTKAESILQSIEINGNGEYFNFFCYKLVIHAFNLKGRRGGAVNNAQRILRELEDLNDETSHEIMKPDVFTYISVAICRSITVTFRRAFSSALSLASSSASILASSHPHCLSLLLRPSDGGEASYKYSILASSSALRCS